MRQIQLKDKEHPIKIDNGVLEQFEEQTGVNAYEFNQKSLKQLKVMTYLACKNANKDFSLTEAEVGSEVSYVTMAPVVEEFFICSLGPEGLKVVEDFDSGKK